MNTSVMTLPVLLCTAVGHVFASGSVDLLNYAATADPSAVMVNFACGSASRGFAWQTDTSVTP